MTHSETVAMNVIVKSKNARCVVVPGLETSLVNNQFVFSVLEPIEAAEWSKIPHPYEGPLGGQLFVMGTVTLSYRNGSKVGRDRFLVVGSRNLEEPLIYDIAISTDRLFLPQVEEEKLKVRVVPPGITVSPLLFDQVMNKVSPRPADEENGEK